MTSVRGLVGIAMLVVACSSDSNGSSGSGEDVSAAFDASKGWHVVQVVTNDDGIIGEGRNGRIELCGLDVAADGHAKVFYWQGWQSQQEFLYRGVRLDDFDASGNRIARKELNAFNELFNDRFPEGGCHLRNGKPTALRLTKSNGIGISWEVYEDDHLAKASTAVAGEFIGRTLYVGDDAAVFGDIGADPNNSRTVFTLKQWNGSDWEYFDKGEIRAGGGAVGTVKLIGGGRVGDAVYAALYSVTPAESKLWVQRWDGKVWSPAFDKTITLGGDANVGWLRSSPRPIVVYSSGEGSHAFEIDVAAKTITERAALSQEIAPQDWAVVNEDLYAVYRDGDQRGVGKAKGATLEPVGKPGFAKSGHLQIAASNGRLYAVTTNALIQHEQLIVATPD